MKNCEVKQWLLKSKTLESISNGFLIQSIKTELKNRRLFMAQIIKPNETNKSKWDFHRWNDFIKSFNDTDYCDTTCSDTITVGDSKIAVRFKAREQF